MVYMHAGQLVPRKNLFTNGMHFFERHVFISCVLNGTNHFAVHFIRAHLPQENTVTANIGFGTMLTDAIANKFRCDRSLYKNILWSFVCHTDCCCFFHSMIPPRKLYTFFVSL